MKRIFDIKKKEIKEIILNSTPIMDQDSYWELMRSTERDFYIKYIRPYVSWMYPKDAKKFFGKADYKYVNDYTYYIYLFESDLGELVLFYTSLRGGKLYTTKDISLSKKDLIYLYFMEISQTFPKWS